MKQIIWAITTVCILFTLTAAAQRGPEMTAEVLASHEAFTPGSDAQVAARFALPKEWHVQAHEPAEDYLIPTVLKLGEAPEGIQLNRAAYPEPKTFRLKNTTEDLLVLGPEFVVGLELALDESLAPGEYTIPATLKYQPCDDTSCIAPTSKVFDITLTVAEAAGEEQHQDVFAAIEWPETAEIEWAEYGGAPGATLRIANVFEKSGAHPGGAWQGALVIQMDDKWHINAHEPLEDYLIPTELTFTGLPEGAEVNGVQYPEPELLNLSFSDEDLAVYEGEFAIAYRIAMPESIEPGAYAANAVLKYQACDDKACYAPKTIEHSITINVVPADQELSSIKSPLTSLVDFEGTWTDGEAQEEITPETEKTEAAAQGDWESLFSEFHVAGQASGIMSNEEFISFIEATEAGRGNESPFGLAGFGLFALVGISLLGGLVLNLTPCVLPIIPINLAIIGAGAKAESRTRGAVLGGAYGLGIATVFGALGLLFVLGLSGFGSINTSPWFNLAITVLFLGLGLAMFDVFVIDFSKLQAKIDTSSKGGSIPFATFMGAVSALLAGACVAPVLVAVLLFAQDQFAKGNYWALALPFVLGIGMALPWPIVGAGLRLLPKPGVWMNKVKYAFGVLIIGVAAYYGYQTYSMFSDRMVDPDKVLASVDESGWHTSLAPALQEGLDENKPVLIDFWATWCKNCMVMNKTVLKDEEVLAKLDDYVKVKYQAEQPSESPHAELLANFDQYVSFPFYTIIQPGDAPEQSSETEAQSGASSQEVEVNVNLRVRNQQSQ